MNTLKAQLTVALGIIGEPERVECYVDEVLKIVKAYNLQARCQCKPEHYNGWEVVRICNVCKKPQPHKFYNHTDLRKKIREVRLSKGLRISDVSFEIKLSRCAISNWEIGRGTMKQDKVRAYAKLLNVEIANH
jgi:hypothetical protein